jgi:hypothetical protein
MNKNEVVLEIYSVTVVIESDCKDLLERLSKDFSYFISDETKGNSLIKVMAFLEVPKKNVIKGERFFKSSKVEVFEDYPIRYSVYDSKGITVWNQLEDCISVFAGDLNLLHEISYLFILSRVGKLLDLKGLHRLHASCFVLEGTLFLGLMSSGVGKSTLTAFLSEHTGVSLYSDDSPLITSKGEVVPFPLRFGFESLGILPKPWSDVESYTLKRRHYGEKRLFSLKNLELAIGGKYHEKHLFIARRVGESGPSISKVSRLKCIRHIVLEGLIGVGLPILVEYFWQKGFKDFNKKTKIFISRLIGFSRLVWGSEAYEIELSDDPLANAEFLIHWNKTRKGT